MAIELKSKGSTLTDAQIDTLQLQMGRRFPETFRRFLLRHNVAVPEPNQFTQKEFSTSVTTFLGVSNNSWEDLIRQVESYSGRMPPRLFPIATAAGGNLIVIDETNGEIFFWDHEGEAGDNEEVTDENVTKLSSSIQEFLDRLQPFDADSVAPDPDAKVTVKPGFYEKFKKYM